MHPKLEQFLNRYQDNPRNISTIECADMIYLLIQHTAPYKPDLDNGAVEGEDVITQALTDIADGQEEKRKPGRPKLTVKAEETE